MGPRELLKFSSSSLGRAGCWVLDWGTPRLRASPSALAIRRTLENYINTLIKNIAYVSSRYLQLTTLLCASVGKH